MKRFPNPVRFLALRWELSIATLLCIQCASRCTGSAQVLLDFGSVRLTETVERDVPVKGDSLTPFRYEAEFVSFGNDGGGVFRFAGPQGPVDATSSPAVFRFLFSPRATGRITGDAVIVRRTYIRGIVQDSTYVFVDLEGTGIPLVVPPRIEEAPAGRFLLFGLDRDVPVTVMDSSIAREFGPYSVTEWRCFSYIAEEGRYVEYSGPAGNRKNPSAWFVAFERGKAYFMISRMQRELRLPAATFQSIDDFYVDVRPGWNLIASPYPLDVDWLRSVQSMQLTGKFAGPYPYRDGRFTLPDASGVIRKEEGYFVFLSDPDPTAVRMLPVILFEKIHAGRGETAGWGVRFRLKTNGWSSECRAGVRSSASGPSAVPIPPLPADAAALGLLPRSVSLHTPLIESYEHDTCSGASWDVVVTRSLRDEDWEFSADLEGTPPEGWTIALADGTGSTATVTSVPAVIRGRGGMPHFRLLAGTTNFVGASMCAFVPAGGFHLEPIYPVPARDAVRSSLHVGVGSTVCVDVIDRLGRVVPSLSGRRYGEGVHPLVVGTAALPAGCYALRARTAEGKSTVSFFIVQR
ncbi:MAG: hypothetical protein QHI48_03750 [Bacteroidota bacterium]|nr:hypothetical protein [Bacteroidota bacterium]